MYNPNRDNSILENNTLWVIKFQPIPCSNKSCQSEMFIPAPAGWGEKWIKTTGIQERKTLDFLEELEQTCEEIKGENLSLEEYEKLSEHEQKMLVDEGIDTLNELLKKYQDLLKHLSPPPEEEEKESD